MGEHNQNPDMTRLKDKDAVMKAHATLTTSKTMGSRLKTPKRLFILKEDWNEQKYGPLFEQKISERCFRCEKGRDLQAGRRTRPLWSRRLRRICLDRADSGAWWGRASCKLSKGWRTGAKPFRVRFVMLRLNRKQELPKQKSCLALLQKHGSPASKAGPKSEAAEPTIAEEEEEEEQESSEDIAATDWLTRGLVKKKKSEAKPKAKAAASKAKAGETGETFTLDGLGFSRRIWKSCWMSWVKNCLELHFSPASQKLRAARSRRLKNEKWPRRCCSWFPKLLPNAKRLKLLQARSRWRKRWKKQRLFWT